MLHIINKNAKENNVVIYSHGNASDLGDVYEFIKTISIIYKVNIIAYDYRGYGISKKFDTNENTTYQDLEYVLSFGINALNYCLPNVILWGFSLGTGPTVEIASRYQNLGGVILQCPLASLLIWADSHANWNYEYSNSDIYCNINKIENIKAKIFIIHGKKDITIDYRHSNLLYEKYVNSKKDNDQIWMVLAEGVGHNEVQFLIEENGGPFFKRIKKFIELVKFPFLNSECNRKRENSRLSYLEKEVGSLFVSFSKIKANSTNIIITRKSDSNLYFNQKNTLNSTQNTQNNDNFHEILENFQINSKKCLLSEKKIKNNDENQNYFEKKCVNKNFQNISDSLDKKCSNTLFISHNNLNIHVIPNYF